MLRCSYAFALLCSCLAGCGDGPAPYSPLDAALVDAARPRDASAEDAAQPLGWVDFAVTGCDSGDGSEASPCIGASPLRLRFTALAPAPVDNQLWDFGDGSELDSSISPEHRYDAPGSYALSLNVEGPGGTAGVIRLAAVVVIPAPLAAECISDAHCGSGDCACEGTGECPDLLSAGMCFLDCASHEACGGNRCINLDPALLADQDWRRTTCVPACDPTGDECGPNKTCQALLGVDGILTHACFTPGLLRGLGSSCVDADENLVASLCASGVCIDQGQRGMCSAPCDVLACPSQSACATFDSGTPTPHCLPNCDSFACDADPALSCQQPGAGFSIDEAPVAAGYCAPSP